MNKQEEEANGLTVITPKSDSDEDVGLPIILVRCGMVSYVISDQELIDIIEEVNKNKVQMKKLTEELVRRGELIKRERKSNSDEVFAEFNSIIRSFKVKTFDVIEKK